MRVALFNSSSKGVYKFLTMEKVYTPTKLLVKLFTSVYMSPNVTVALFFALCMKCAPIHNALLYCVKTVSAKCYSWHFLTKK